MIPCMVCVGLQKKNKALEIVNCMCTTVSHGQDWDLVVLGTIHRHAE